MSDSETPVPPLAQALGKVASGLFVVTSTGPDGPLGFVASFVIQAGFEPPTVSVAVAKGRDHLAAIREQGGFAVSIVDKESSGAMGAFFKKREPGESPFDDLATHGAPSGIPVLSDALGWTASSQASTQRATTSWSMAPSRRGPSPERVIP